MIVGQHIQWNSLCDTPVLDSILNRKLNDFIVATDPTYGQGELTYYYQVDYYNQDIIISVYQYVDGVFSRVGNCGYNNNKVQTSAVVAPSCTPSIEAPSCCTQETATTCAPPYGTLPIPQSTNDHTKLINQNADANFQHVTLAEKQRWNSQTTDVLGTILTGLTEASIMTNLEPTDTVLGAFGKIKKWFSSLKTLAFKDKVDWNSDIDNIPTDLVQDSDYVHTDNNYTDADAQTVANTSGTNTGDQVADGVTITGTGTIADPFVATPQIPDLSGYLLKDTTLQTADTPENTSLFSFWKIGVGRVKIAWSDLLNTIRHNQLMGLSWLDSGHTGTANKLAGFDSSGIATEYIRDSFATSNATSGTVTLAENTSLALETTLTSSHTLTITPTVPSVFDPPRWQELLLTVGATLPAITWTTPSGVVYEFPDKAFTVGLTANKKYMFLYKWISATRCIVSRKEY